MQAGKRQLDDLLQSLSEQCSQLDEALKMLDARKVSLCHVCNPCYLLLVPCLFMLLIEVA